MSLKYVFLAKGFNNLQKIPQKSVSGHHLLRTKSNLAVRLLNFLNAIFRAEYLATYHNVNPGIRDSFYKPYSEQG